MFKNLSLSLLTLAGMGLLNACASQSTTSPTNPADCLTARRDMTALQNETASVVEKTIAGEERVFPFSSIVAILSGPYDVRTPVSVGQYTADMKSKMSQIREEYRI